MPLHIKTGKYILNRIKQNSEPLVSVLIPTYNRAAYLGSAIESALTQDYPNFEVIVIRDGGTDISSIINKVYDSRLKFINRDYNKGKPYSLNEALQAAKGKYICYLDDDDIYYPHHIRTLVDVLEDGEKYQVAYSDLYKAHCVINPDNSRTIRAKNVEISRDFDRFFLLHFNLALHVSLMHRKDLLKKTGLYNENLKIMIDWDFNRRAAFYADFKHIHTITGQFYGPIGDCDRISVVNRKNKSDYIRNILTIKTTRPPKTWDKLKDLSVIFILNDFTAEDTQTLMDIWLHTFYPYQVFIPICKSQFQRFNTEMPVAVKIPVDDGASIQQKIDAALHHCQGDYTAIIYSKMPIKECWAERAIRYFQDFNTSPAETVIFENSPDYSAAVISQTKIIADARARYANLSIAQSLDAAGAKFKQFAEIPYCFEFDSWLATAKDMQNEKRWLQAANLYSQMAQTFQNHLWMNTMRAYALYNAGNFQQALEIIKAVNAERPTVFTRLLNGKILNRLGNFTDAVEILNIANDTIEEKTKLWIH